MFIISYEAGVRKCGSTRQEKADQSGASVQRKKSLECERLSASFLRTDSFNKQQQPHPRRFAFLYTHLLTRLTSRSNHLGRPENLPSEINPANVKLTSVTTQNHNLGIEKKMAREPTNTKQAAKPVADVIELSSDSEPETVETKPQQIPSVENAPQEKPAHTGDYEQPLLKVVGIKYKTDKTENQPQQDMNSTPLSSKMTLRSKGTGSVKHKHVSIEIPLPSSSLLRKKASGDDESGEESGHEVFKTPMERRHITFNDSDQEDFVTPSEAPRRNPLELQIKAETAKEEAAKEEDEEESEDESDDEAPEAVSTRVAEAQTTKAAEAAAKAVEEYVTPQFYRMFDLLTLYTDKKLPQSGRDKSVMRSSNSRLRRESRPRSRL